MAELTTEQLIKILIGVFVIVVVAIGLFLFFKNQIIGFFKNLPGANVNESVKLILGILK